MDMNSGLGKFHKLKLLKVALKLTKTFFLVNALTFCEADAAFHRQAQQRRGGGPAVKDARAESIRLN